MHFSSKKDAWFLLVFWAIILYPLYLYAGDGEIEGFQLISYDSWLGYLLVALLDGLLIWIWFGTVYIVEDEYLKVRSGPIRRKIKIEDISRIRPVRSIFSAPALSFNRLEIRYGNQYYSVQISPKDKEDFIRLLQEKQPGIEVMRSPY